MMRSLLDAAARLDRWLHRRLGRPYGVMLTVGLALEFIHHLREMPEKLTELHRAAPLVAFAVLNLALLIHQLAELGERTEHK